MMIRCINATEDDDHAVGRVCYRCAKLDLIFRLRELARTRFCLQYMEPNKKAIMELLDIAETEVRDGRSPHVYRATAPLRK
jgi:hypothetical protein